MLDAGRRYLTGTRLEILLISVTICGIASNTFTATVLPDMVDSFERSAAASGLIQAAATLPGIFLAPVSGLLVDLWGRRRLLTASLLVFGIAGMGAAVAPTFEWVVVCRVVQGIGASGLMNVVIVLIAAHWHAEDRARIIGRNAAAFTMTLALSPVLGGLVAQVLGWRAVFWLFGLALIPAGFAWWRLPPDVPTHQHATSHLRRGFAELRRPAISQAVVVSMVAAVGIFGLFYTVLPELMADEFDLEPGLRGILLGLPALASTPAALSLARGVRSVGMRRMLAAAMVMFAAGFIAMGLGSFFAVIVVGCLLYGAAEGIAVPGVQLVVTNNSDDEVRGAAMGAFQSTQRLAQTIAPLIAGWAYVAVGPELTFTIPALAMVAVAVAVMRRGDISDVTAGSTRQFSMEAADD